MRPSLSPRNRQIVSTMRSLLTQTLYHTHTLYLSPPHSTLHYTYSCSTGPVYMGLPVKSKLFSVILHYRYLSPKLLSSASQHKTMFHKNDIDRNRNNIGCVGGHRRLKHLLSCSNDVRPQYNQCYCDNVATTWTKMANTQ